MNQPLATLIAAIVTAAGSTLVGALAVLFAWRQNAKTLAQQRQMAADERLGERRVTLYLRLLEILLSGERPDAMISKLREFLPQVVAFASDEVEGHFDDVHQSTSVTDIDVKLASLISIIRSELQPSRVVNHRVPPQRPNSALPSSTAERRF